MQITSQNEEVRLCLWTQTNQSVSIGFLLRKLTEQKQITEER